MNGSSSVSPSIGTPSANGFQSSVSAPVTAQYPLIVEPGIARTQPCSTRVSSPNRKSSVFVNAAAGATADRSGPSTTWITPGRLLQMLNAGSQV
ncbi:hypothetical protein [Nannocystis pusilla]|uniref:hypothetical protein n=1 Tax=Nannocystis pusilla TaxID=889268 RepID=UPI003B82BB3C